MRGLPDSGLVVRMTRGRAWIGVLSVLLAGIVALNVVSLSLSASQGQVSQQIRTLEQENSALRARLAQRLSNDRVASAAASLGMAVPGPDDIAYRDASGQAVRLMVQRLAGFDIGSSLVSETPAPTTAEPVIAEPVVTETAAPPVIAEPAAPATTVAAPEPVAAAPVTAQPAPAAPAPPVASGGGVSPG